MRLATITLAKNEEKNIDQCLASIRFADEQIVIDDFSSDSTKEIAQRNGAKVYQRAMQGDYASQYNYALSKVTAEWILIVDADELVTPELRDEILSVIADNMQNRYKKAILNFA